MRGLEALSWAKIILRSPQAKCRARLAKLGVRFRAGRVVLKVSVFFECRAIISRLASAALYAAVLSMNAIPAHQEIKQHDCRAKPSSHRNKNDTCPRQTKSARGAGSADAVAPNVMGHNICEQHRFLRREGDRSMTMISRASPAPMTVLARHIVWHWRRTRIKAKRWQQLADAAAYRCHF